MSDESTENNNNVEKGQRKTVVIFGINSFIGSNLAEFLKNDYRVVGTYHKKNVKLPGILSLPCDVLTKEELQLIFYAFKPDFAIYCVGMTSLRKCAEFPNSSDALNSVGLYNIADLAPRYNCRIVYLSSHFVFSGINKAYNEMDNPDSITQYGKSLLSSEFYLQKSSLNYLILRCGHIYGRGASPFVNTFFEQLQFNCAANISAPYDNYLMQGFVDVTYLSMVIKMCLDRNISNRLIHFTSQDIMTSFQFARTYCEVFSVSDSLITKGKTPFPILKSATIEKIEEKLYFKLDLLNVEGLLKIKIPTIKESLEFTFLRFQGQKDTDTSKPNISKNEGITFI